MSRKKIAFAPFPYFGKKSNASGLIWSRFGTDLGNYVEPFFGSGAVLLNRPEAFGGWMTVNDLSGHVANVWRAMRYAPEMVAKSACDPVNECDLHARHLWLVSNTSRLSSRLMADPYYHEPEAAGWWVWGACAWIGGGWCSGRGPWHAELDDDGVATFVLGGGGQGVTRQLPDLSGRGRGVNRRLPNLSGGGQGVNRLNAVADWFAELSAKMDGVRVCCGDWSRVCSVGTMTRNGMCAVLLDPPYSLTAAVYAEDSTSVSGDVRKWCEANGGNPLLRIALCGHAGEGHEVLEAQGWTVSTWDKTGGYQGADDRERIWFSPACIRPDSPDGQTNLFGAVA